MESTLSSSPVSAGLAQPPRSWRVLSNMPGVPDYSIQGAKLESALGRSLSFIAGRTLPKSEKLSLLGAWADWQPDIIQGKGGVELRLKAETDEGRLMEFVAWVDARPEELLEPIFIDTEQGEASPRRLMAE